jgi:hypothetical protein
MDHARLKIVMGCFDRLPQYQRDWINNCEKLNLHDDHILRGKQEVDRCMAEVEKGRISYKPGNGQN